jgi:roadblock/LC7 domain-containing protein
MKYPAILLSVFFCAALLDGGLAASKAAAKKESPSQTASVMAANQAMYDCQALYAGRRGFLGRDRYAFIETCFKAATGKYPFQAGANCTLRRC